MTPSTSTDDRSVVGALSDAVTMLSREMRHTRRFPMMLIASVVMPVLMLSLFDYFLGGALGRGLAGSGGGGRGGYLNYLVPGILVMTIAAGTSTISVGVCADMTHGIIDRFRSMPIAHGSVLAGHVVGGMARMTLTVGMVAGAAALISFRPSAGLLGWLGAAVILGSFGLALSWLSVAMGLVAKTPAGANSATLPLLLLLPFTSSAFVPAGSMSAGPRWFAEHQPFTPIVESVRGLLVGGPVAEHAVAALAWCAALTAVGAWAALAAFRRNART